MFYCRYSYDWGEVMNSFDSMKTKLECTGLYKVTAKSNIRAELLAYAEGLNTEFDMLETMERELFIDTAENCGITERERFVGKINADYPLENEGKCLKYLSRRSAENALPTISKELSEVTVWKILQLLKLPQETVWTLKFRIQKQTQRRSS